jgi:hypothetical protein
VLELEVGVRVGRPCPVLVLGSQRGGRSVSPLGGDEDLALHPDEELEVKDDDNMCDDATDLFGIDLGDGT